MVCSTCMKPYLPNYLLYVPSKFNSSKTNKNSEYLTCIVALTFSIVLLLKVFQVKVSCFSQFIYMLLLPLLPLLQMYSFSFNHFIFIFIFILNHYIMNRIDRCFLRHFRMFFFYSSVCWYMDTTNTYFGESHIPITHRLK